MKRFEIEYTLSNGDWCHNVFTGKNKTEALKNYNRETGVPKSKVISIEEIVKEVTSVQIKYANHDNDMLFTNLELANKLYKPVWTKEYINENWTGVFEDDFSWFDFKNPDTDKFDLKPSMRQFWDDFNDWSTSDLLKKKGCEAIFIQQDPKNGNIDHTSMSIGDLIIYTFDDKTQEVYYVDRVGFTKVATFGLDIHERVEILDRIDRQYHEDCTGSYVLDGETVEYTQKLDRKGRVIEPEPKVGMFANIRGYSDVNPYIITRVSPSGKTMTIVPLDAKKDPSFKPEWVAGGFAGHCTNQHDQKWFYFTEKTTVSGQVRKSSKGWMKGRVTVSERPVKFYDYNF